jgi:hypothetical protein
MQFYWLTLGVLAAWRLTHLLNGEDGPWDIFVKFRLAVGDGFWGELLDCFYCLSLAVALPLALCIGADAMERALLWPALSAGAILLERATSRAPEAGRQQSDTQESDHVLQGKADADADGRRS